MALLQLVSLAFIKNGSYLEESQEESQQGFIQENEETIPSLETVYNQLRSPDQRVLNLSVFQSVLALATFYLSLLRFLNQMASKFEF